MVSITKMRLAFEAAVRTPTRSPLKFQVVKSLKRRIGVRFSRKKS